MRIDWWTLALQAVNVLILVWLLGRFLFRPVMDAIVQAGVWGLTGALAVLVVVFAGTAGLVLRRTTV